jgi:hypothetical protein
MDHRLVHDLEKAFGWSGPDGLGKAFARGSLSDAGLCIRLLTPARLLVHPQAFLRAHPIRRAEPVQLVDMQRLGRLLKEGCTLVMDGANVYDPTLEVACRALQWWSHELVQVNLYLTTGEAAGFELHWDDHDVVVVQLAGEKSWEVRGLSRPAPLYRDAVPNPEAPDEVVWAGTMQAGEVMHIPRGYWHQATRKDRGNGFSLHATFGFPKRTGVDWLSWLADQSRAHELFRYDLHRWGTADQRHNQHLALVDDAVRLVATKPVTEFLAVRERQQSAARHLSTHGLFGPLSSVVCVTEFAPDLAEEGQHAVVRAAGAEIRFATRALPALSVLLSGAPTELAAVSAATGVDADALAEVLVAEGVCAEVTAELVSGYAGLMITAGQ